MIIYDTSWNLKITLNVHFATTSQCQGHFQGHTQSKMVVQSSLKGFFLLRIKLAYFKVLFPCYIPTICFIESK